jgi:hypothetical protein
MRSCKGDQGLRVHVCAHHSARCEAVASLTHTHTHTHTHAHVPEAVATFGDERVLDQVKAKRAAVISACTL